ncbi:hypothetical protein ACFPM7_06890 [Actinokineospora guangxiensis]|uniref:Small secreted protein n=1 Tax=Actinokineospora guangxiensis TaxID=1490288 RepID=A0ABW0EH80_9PSEU
MVRRSAFAVSAAVVLALAGCSGDGQEPGEMVPPTTTAGAPAETGEASGAVAWAEQVCAAVAPEVEKLGAGPNIDPSNPQAAKDGLVTYLGDMVDSLDRMIDGMEDAGAPPVPDGQVAVDRATGTLEEAKGSVESAKAELEKADVNDPAAFQAAFTKVGEDLQKLSDLDNPMAGLRGNKELNDAFQQAESCKKLAGTGSTGTVTPTS